MHKLISKTVEIGVKELYDEKVNKIRTSNKELVARMLSASESSVHKDDIKNY